MRNTGFPHFIVSKTIWILALIYTNLSEIILTFYSKYNLFCWWLLWTNKERVTLESYGLYSIHELSQDPPLKGNGNHSNFCHLENVLLAFTLPQIEIY